MWVWVWVWVRWLQAEGAEKILLLGEAQAGFCTPRFLSLINPSTIHRGAGMATVRLFEAFSLHWFC